MLATPRRRPMAAAVGDDGDFISPTGVGHLPRWILADQCLNASPCCPAVAWPSRCCRPQDLGGSAPRRGPNVVGPFGLLPMSFADFPEIRVKEPIIRPAPTSRVFVSRADGDFVLRGRSWAVIPWRRVG